MSPMDRLIELVDAARCGVVFTGAGVSTESGIPDFRSPGGVWSRHKPVMYDDFVASRAARVSYWKMRVEAYRDFEKAQPNDGHIAIAGLEATGRICAVITQNIDGLHQMAGSRRIIELHGTARMVGCIGCGKEWLPDVIHARIEAGDEAPDCEHCGEPLKSKTISFGQAMPVGPMSEAAQLARSADVFLAVGSSLVVEPAASIPRLAKDHGCPLVIINNEGTPLDELADVVVREPAGCTLRLLAEHCKDDAS